MNEIIERERLGDNSKESKRKRGYSSRLVSFFSLFIISVNMVLMLIVWSASSYFVCTESYSPVLKKQTCMYIICIK